MEVYNITPQFILALLGILAVLISIWKVLYPGIQLKIISFYYTLNKERKVLIILKLQTISNVALMLENIIVSFSVDNGKNYKMTPVSFRWKGIFLKTLDIRNEERDYVLQKPLEPDLRICGIKQGNSECYISMISEEVFEDQPIKLWSFDLKWRQYLLPIPNLPFFNRKQITISQPKPNDCYFDDSLFKKISKGEREKLIEEL
ncbi:MAG TPA: hypothetical protein VLZ07_12775 [Syntrophales bacterium]|nr:hypothetical protein [Syntrophales bacterium]